MQARLNHGLGGLISTLGVSHPVLCPRFCSYTNRPNHRHLPLPSIPPSPPTTTTLSLSLKAHTLAAARQLLLALLLVLNIFLAHHALSCPHGARHHHSRLTASITRCRVPRRSARGCARGSPGVYTTARSHSRDPFSQGTRLPGTSPRLICPPVINCSRCGPLDRPCTRWPCQGRIRNGSCTLLDIYPLVPTPHIPYLIGPSPPLVMMAC